MLLCLVLEIFGIWFSLEYSLEFVNPQFESVSGKVCVCDTHCCTCYYSNYCCTGCLYVCMSPSICLYVYMFELRSFCSVISSFSAQERGTYLCYVFPS